ISYNSYCLEEVKNSFDIIISNPPIRAGKQVVGKIIKDSYDHLNNQGKLVIVIQKKQGAPSAKRLMEETYGFCEILKRDKGYYILCSQR
ncbi:methyltransferase, partial [Eggerthia catenaformis]